MSNDLSFISVLLADDRPSDLEMATLVLKRISPRIQIRCFSDGNSLLEYVRNERPDPTLLILDQIMPGLSGVELAKELKSQELVHAPIYLLSGSELYLQKVLPEDLAILNGHYVKPLNFSDNLALFSRMCHEAIDQARLRAVS